MSDAPPKLDQMRALQAAIDYAAGREHDHTEKAAQLRGRADEQEAKLTALQSLNGSDFEVWEKTRAFPDQHRAEITEQRALADHHESQAAFVRATLVEKQAELKQLYAEMPPPAPDPDDPFEKLRPQSQVKRPPRQGPPTLRP